MTLSVSFDCEYQYPSGFRLDAQFETNEQVTALTGPSGSGKTTMLSLVAGLLKPTRGCVRLGDEVITNTNEGICLRPEQRAVGMLFQEHCLFPHLRVRDNIEFGRRRRPDVKIPVDRIISTLELDDLLERYPRSLSGGQQQRVALARAMASSPKILLLDEPLISVEESLRERIALFIERIVSEFEIPVLLASHHQELIDRLATRTITMNNGRVVRPESTTEE